MADEMYLFHTQTESNRIVFARILSDLRDSSRAQLNCGGVSMFPIRLVRKLFVVFTAFAVSMTALPTAEAEQVGTFEWTGAVSNDWSDPGNWTLVDGIDVNGDGLPNRNGDDSELVVFNAAGAQNVDTILGVSRNIGALHFNSNATSTVTIGGLIANDPLDPESTVIRLTIDGSRGRGDVEGGPSDNDPDGLFMPNDFYPIDIYVPANQHHKIVGSNHIQGSGRHELVFHGKQVWHIEEGGSLEFDVRIRQSANNQTLYEKTGDGMLIISAHQAGDNSWNFGSHTHPDDPRFAFQVSGGTLRFAGVDTSMPRGLNQNAYTVNDGATMEFHRPGGNLRYQNNRGTLTLNGHGYNGQGALLSSGGTNRVEAGLDSQGAFILATDSTIKVTADTLEIRQGITGPGGLIKTGSGILYFAIDDPYEWDTSFSYTGNTTVAEGTLALVDQSPAPWPRVSNITQSPVIQVDAVATLDVSAKVGSLITLGESAPQMLKGDGEVVGNVAFATGSSLGVDFDGNTIDSLDITGSLDISNAAVDFNKVGANLTAGAHVFATYGSLLGSMFADVVDLPSGFSIDYNYSGGNQIALVGAPDPALAGDFNDDGIVDAADYVWWRDRNAEASQYQVWRNDFGGSTTGSGAAEGAKLSANAVPEPAALSMCGLLLAMIALKRTHRRRLT